MLMGFEKGAGQKWVSSDCMQAAFWFARRQGSDDFKKKGREATINSN